MRHVEAEGMDAEPAGYPDWYAEWAERHRVAFLLRQDDFLAAAAAWWHTFAAMGATEDELAAATREVQAADAPPKYPGDHLPAVRAAVGRLRDRALAAERQRADAGPEWGVCADCQDTGAVVVPMPAHGRGDRRVALADGGGWRPWRHTPAGDPVYLTFAVTCRCRRGVKAHEYLTLREKDPLSLARYEQVNPRWRDQLAERAAAEAARFAALRAIPVGPGALVAEVARATRLPRGGRG